MTIFLIKNLAGQDSSISIGVSGGQNYNTMRGTPFFDEYHKTKTGFLGGFYLSYKITKNIKIRTELLYEIKGSSAEIYNLTDIEGFSIGLYRGDFHYEYLSLPLLFNPTFGNNLRIFANVGPYFSFLIMQKDDMGVTVTESAPLYPAKSMDFGLITGLGILIPLNENVSISIEGRNSLGLFDIGDIPVFYDHGAIKHNSIGVIGSLIYTIVNN